MTETTAAHRSAAAPSGARLGDRLRLLRVAAGLTQTELAGDRFSKEYVSQIERGKTRPTADTVEWLAQRLNVDPAFLSSGISTDERSRVEALLVRAEALSKGYRYKEAVDAYEDVRAAVSADQSRSTTLSREWLIFKPPLYSMKPSFRNLFRKKLTRERVVPTISASVSCDTFGSTR